MHWCHARVHRRHAGMHGGHARMQRRLLLMVEGFGGGAAAEDMVKARKQKTLRHLHCNNKAAQHTNEQPVLSCPPQPPRVISFPPPTTPYPRRMHRCCAALAWVHGGGHGVCGCARHTRVVPAKTTGCTWRVGVVAVSLFVGEGGRQQQQQGGTTIAAVGFTRCGCTQVPSKGEFLED